MSASLPQSATDLRDKVTTLVEQQWVGRFIVGLILINAVLLGMETSASLMAQYGTLMLTLDKLLLGVFVVELLLRIYAYRSAFFKDAWSLFDFAVVAIALIPASGPLAVLRSLRPFGLANLVGLVWPARYRGSDSLWLGSLVAEGSDGVAPAGLYS